MIKRMITQHDHLGFPDSARLHKLVDGAFAWLLNNLEFFDPLKNKTESNLHRSKAMLELAWLCMHYQQTVPNNGDGRIQKIISTLNNIWQKPEYQDRMMRQPDKLRLYAMTYIALLNCGVADPVYRNVIQRMLDQGYVTAVEELPFRALDTRYMLDCGDFKHKLQSYNDLYAETLLAKNPPILYCTDFDVYCITHTLFYVSDFGNRSIDDMLGMQVPSVRWMIGTLLGIYLRLKNWDLVGELLICCHCLKWSPPTIFNVSWEAMLDAQLPDGSIPGPDFSHQKLQQLEGLDQQTYCFEKNYHTTLVGALAGFLIMDSDTANNTALETEMIR